MWPAVLSYITSIVPPIWICSFLWRRLWQLNHCGADTLVLPFVQIAWGLYHLPPHLFPTTLVTAHTCLSLLEDSPGAGRAYLACTRRARAPGNLLCKRSLSTDYHRSGAISINSPSPFPLTRTLTTPRAWCRSGYPVQNFVYSLPILGILLFPHSFLYWSFCF